MTLDNIDWLLYVSEQSYLFTSSRFLYSAPGSVSTGMGDRSGVQLPVQVTYLSSQYVTSHPVQLSLAISGGDALWMGSKGRYGSCVGDK